MATIISSSEKQARTFLVDEVKVLGDPESYIYIGVAKLGSSTSSPVWQIRKVTSYIKPEGAGETTSIQYANGSQRYNQKWDDRLTLTYSNQAISFFSGKSQ